LMTTLCAMLGGVPLMLGTGIGSELRQPLGYAMVGGLAVSQVLTLFTTPVVYLYMDKLSRVFTRSRSTKDEVRTHDGARVAEIISANLALPVRRERALEENV
jgi:hypothetical protein